MKKTLIIIFSWILVIVWMGAIYWLSDMNGTESSRKSEKTINLVIKKSIEAANEVGLTNKNANSKKISRLADHLDYPLRKVMHVSVYFILTLLLLNAFYQSGLRSKKLIIWALLVAILYACSDEYHQSFTGRTASFLDILIDSVGGLIAICLVILIKKIKLKKSRNILRN